ncbi:endonuclease domain-containing 1 protein-like [Lampris incognitus]|uniref:endonuclease domain-containing 1 protein-like n=1 Tax=Lampris incognitus TaxID=2546036 RepID=UPI0024B50387|nr:endonuclease domain-containing 1 protein-like [Lampris incognitus]
MSRGEMPPSSKGALLLLLACLGGLALGEVGDFSHCLDFFYKRMPPQGINTEQGRYLAPICQRYKNQYRFASLYHRQHRTPWYSAYIITPPAGKRPASKWMYEPQLAFSKAPQEMSPFPSRKFIDQNLMESQAMLLDYTNSSYTKGHLNPSLHHQETLDRRATFTLTNIVPQQKGSNSGPWAQLEVEVKTRFLTFCDGPMYVITGAIPYLSGDRWIKNRVAVPEYMWSAYCCPSYNASLPESARIHFPTYAAVGRNDPQSGEDIVPVDRDARPSPRGYDVKQMPLEALEAILEQRLGMPVSLFHEQCG